MDIVELAQNSGNGVAAASIAFVTAVCGVVVVAIFGLLRLNSRCKVLAAENHELRYSLYALHERVDAASGQLEQNQQSQRAHLGLIADMLQHQRSIGATQFDSMRRADPLLPGSILPDVDLHASEDYDGEPLVHSDPSRVIAAAPPEPDLLSHLQPLPENVGDVADESGLSDQHVANEPFEQVRHSVWGRQR